MSPSFYRVDNWVLQPLGPAVAGASVAVLTDPSDFTTQPGTPLATIYGAPNSNSATVTAAVWAAQQITFTLNAVPADVVPGAYIAVSGVTPSTYDSTLSAPWLVLAVNGLEVIVQAFTNPGTWVSGGTVATSVLPNPLATDGNGHYYFYAASGLYGLQVYGPTIDEQDYPDQSIGFNNAGSVTSVGLTAPSQFIVSGSPVTMAGTLGLAWHTVADNLVFAGPASGPAAAPTFRALVASDIPSLTFVSSVGLSIAVPNVLTGSVAGSPVTGSGTLALTLGLVNQSANTVWAGPTSGGAAQPTFRALVAADIAESILPASIVSLTSLVLSAPITPANATPTAIMAITVTMPASGTLCRALVSYSAFWYNNNTCQNNVWVSDGTNTFAAHQANCSGANLTGGASVFDISPVRYANGANITFTLYAYNNTGTTEFRTSMYSGAGPTSYMRVALVTSN